MKRSEIKRGMSSIIATLLIIMLVLVVVGILWVVIRNLMLSQSELAGVQGEFFSENVGIKSVKINEPLVSLSMERIGGDIKINQRENKTETIIVIETDIISVVDLSGSMTQCIDINSTCCTSTLGGSYSNNICTGVNTNRGINCTSICKGTLYLVSGRNNGQFSGFYWNGINWASNTRVVYHLDDVGSNSVPSIFYKDGKQYIISGNDSGLFKGFVWNVFQNSWIRDSTINASLPDIGSNSAPSVFNMSGSLYLISGENAGDFKGFIWDGSQWIPNFIINASLSDIGDRSVPYVFYKDSSWYLIAGNTAGRFYGYTWNGANWITNLTINLSLPDIGANSAPSVFYKDSSWYLISGESGGNFRGFVWNGTNWRPNSTINASLTDIGSNSIPFVFYRNAIWLDRLTPTKEANKELVNSVLSASPENRVGLVAYNNDIVISSSHNLTNNINDLNNTINSWQATSGTCICCGINEASDRLYLQSDNETSKKIIVMSDGEATRTCTRQGTTNPMLDAIKSSCDAKLVSSNLTIHAIGAGEGVNETTLTNIAVGCGGGKYYSAINVSELVEIYRQVAEEITRTYKSKSNFNYLIIKFYNATTSYTEKITVLPDVLVVKNYNFDLTGKLDGKIIKIEIYPVAVTDTGKEIIGDVLDSWP